MRIRRSFSGAATLGKGKRRASALRYDEEIALRKPAERRSGRRYYGSAELKRLALIQFLQDTGRLSLEEIADVLANRTSAKISRKLANDRIAILDDQIRSAEAARSYLEYRLSCPRENPFDGCPALTKEVDRRLRVAGLRVQASDAQAMALTRAPAIQRVYAMAGSSNITIDGSAR
ncbi:MAG: MerR family transcriptional regulator [Stellaceae bacterium]